MREVESKLHQEISKRDTLLLEQERNFQSHLGDYERQLREKYSKFIEEHQQQVQKEQALKTQHELKDMERRMLLEEEKMKFIEETERVTEEKAKEKYSKLLQSIEDHWKKETEARETRIHLRMKQHYETLLKAKQDQLDHALQVNDDIDKAERARWSQTITELKEKHSAVLQTLEQKLKEKYDSLLQEYEKQYQDQLDKYEAQNLQQFAKSDKMFWSRRIRKLKIAFAKWKFDYQTQLQEKYESMMNSMQNKFIKDFDELAQQNTAMKQKETFDGLVQRERDLQKDQESARPSDSHHAKQEKQRQISSLKNSVEKLWDALEVDHEDRSRFKNNVHSVTHDADLVHQHYEKECKKLTDKLPIMQAVTRREFVKHRLYVICCDVTHTGSHYANFLLNLLHENIRCLPKS